MFMGYIQDLQTTRIYDIAYIFYIYIHEYTYT